jgi:quercetin dioxygenase-like cupin family protein
VETISKGIVVLPNAGKSMQMRPGETLIFKAVSAETDGAYTLIEVIDEPQEGPSLHLHRREDKSFYILEGTVAFQIGDRTLVATAGCFIQAPKGVPHGYKNIGTTPGKMLLLFVPAGIETFFEDFAKLTAAGTVDEASIMSVAKKHEIEFVA